MHWPKKLIIQIINPWELTIEMTKYDYTYLFSIIIIWRVEAEWCSVASDILHYLYLLYLVHHLFAVHRLVGEQTTDLAFDKMFEKFDYWNLSYPNGERKDRSQLPTESRQM